MMRDNEILLRLIRYDATISRLRNHWTVPGLPEAVWFELRGHGASNGLGMVTCFGLGRWNIADRFEQASVVEPVDPFERGKIHGLGRAPRSA
jgi:hypothetical protein